MFLTSERLYRGGRSGARASRNILRISFLLAICATDCEQAPIVRAAVSIVLLIEGFISVRWFRLPSMLKAQRMPNGTSASRHYKLLI